MMEECSGNHSGVEDALLPNGNQTAFLLDKSILTKQLNELTTHKEAVTLSTTFLVWTSVLAVASAAVFFFSAQKASADYIDLLPDEHKEASFVFEWIAPLSVAATNTIFNHEVFLNLWGSIVEIWKVALSYCYYFCKHPFKEIIAWSVSAATILPFWYIGMNDPVELFIPETISSLLCLFVFYNGAETCYQVAAYPSMQLLWLNTQLNLWHLASICFKDKARSAIGDCRYRIEMTKARALLVEALEDKYYTFYYTTPVNRVWFFNHLNDGDIDVLNALLEQRADMPQIPNLAYQSPFLLFIRFFFSFFAMAQNFGHVIESYKAGAELLSPPVGVIFALFNLVPSIGFTIKGILGYGPAEMALEIGGWRQSAMQQSSPGYYRWIWLMRFSDFFSGFSNNAVNTIGAKACGASNQEAFVVGLIANIGTVFGFNGPQCELWFQTNIMEYLLAGEFPNEILLQKNLRELSGTMRTYSQNKFETFVRDPEYAGTLSAFFLSKGFSLPAAKPAKLSAMV